MQIELIETFLDLCETRSFTQTAERLGITQSAVSGRVRALERALGRSLFRRSRAGTELTTEGLRFEPHARSLRLNWTEALNAIRHGGSAAMELRVGLQHDLAIDHFGAWVGEFRALLPEAAYYIETDYSTQMCFDIVAGRLDLAVLFTPTAQPDLHFETLGEVAYVMVSTETDRLEEVRPESYLLANYSPAFARTHAALYPALSAGATVSSGQNAAVAGLLSALGGSAYLLSATAETLVAKEHAMAVRGARPIPQSVFAAIHLRDRHRRIHRRLVELLRTHFLDADRPPRRARSA